MNYLIKMKYKKINRKMKNPKYISEKNMQKNNFGMIDLKNQKVFLIGMQIGKKLSHHLQNIQIKFYPQKMKKTIKHHNKFKMNFKKY